MMRLSNLLHSVFSPVRSSLAGRPRPRRTWGPLGHLIAAEVLEDRALLSGSTLFPIRTFNALGAESVTTGDLNGDGVTDLATANRISSTVSVLLGNGDGTFQTERTFGVGLGPVFAATGDLNGDGVTDLVTANGSGGSVSVLLGSGDGSFQTAQDFAVGGSFPECVGVAIGDFDADGVTDVAAASDNLIGSDTVTILLGNGDGTFQPKQNITTGFGPSSIATSDFDGDSILDLVTANVVGRSVSVLLGAGDGTFLAAGAFAVGFNPVSLAVADFDRDGIADLATANEASNDASVLLGNGDGTFQSAQRFATAAAPQSITSGDFNGDNVADLATANKTTTNLSVLLGRGDGTFHTSQNYGSTEFANSVTTGDFNGDGIVDITTANVASGNVSVLLGSGDGAFPKTEGFAVGNGPQSVKTADFDRDGVVDLATANRFSNSVSVLLGNGDGTFRTAQYYSVGSAPVEVVAGDFNADGITDLATGNFNTRNVSVLLGRGDGTFHDAQNYAIGRFDSGLISLTAEDFDGDGAIDLATANIGSGNLSVFFGNGDGTFQSNMSFPLGIVSPRAVTAGDFNNDGAFDLVAVDTVRDIALVVISNGDGTFKPPQSVPAADGPRAVATGHVNGDSFTDIVITHDSGEAVVLLGNGDGTFQSSVSSSIGNRSRSVIISDIDSDGATDLVTANGGDVSVLFGNGDGTFGPTESYAAGPDAAAVAAGDFNRDGVKDLAAANNAGGIVTVLLGAPANQPPAVSDFTKIGTEDSPVVFAATDFTEHFSDPDGDAPVEVRIDSLPIGGVLELDGVTVTPGQVIAVADLDGLCFKPDLNFNGETTFTYSASDGTAFSVTPATVTLDILSADEQSEIIFGKIQELLAAGLINDGQAESLTFMLKENNGDAGKVQAFLNEVQAYISGGILTEEQAHDLLVCGNLLLISLTNSSDQCAC